MSEVIDLKRVDALKRIQVRDDIVLQPLEITDAPRILEILADDPGIRRRNSVARRIHSTEDVESEIANAGAVEDIIRYSILKNGRYIGLITFWRLGDFMTKWNGTDLPEHDTYGFGYFLDPAERGQGITVMAIKAIMEIVQTNLHPKRFMAFCEDDNAPSIAVLRKCGLLPTDEILHFPKEGWHERKYVFNVPL